MWLQILTLPSLDSGKWLALALSSIRLLQYRPACLPTNIAANPDIHEVPGPGLDAETTEMINTSLVGKENMNKQF